MNQLTETPVPNWIPRKKPSLNSLRGRYCILEQYHFDKQGAALFEAFQLNQGEGWAYLPYGPCHTLEEFKTCMSKICKDKDTLIYSISDIKTKQPIGVCGYLHMNPEHGAIEVGHLHYSKLLQKTPAATEAMYLLMKHVFDDLRYRRYEWKCNALNIPSWKAAERLGFQFEGLFRQSNVFKGMNRDTTWFSILDREWPALKIKFEKWLNPDNFNSEGKQKRKLQDS